MRAARPLIALVATSLLWVPLLVSADGEVSGSASVNFGQGGATDTTGCGPGSVPVTYGGLSTNIQVATAERDKPRFIARGTVEADIIDPPETSGQRAGHLRVAGRLIAGFDSRFFEVRTGASLIDLERDGEVIPIPSIGFRFGPRDGFYVRLGLMDGPRCFVAECLVGANIGFRITETVGARAGLSVGFGTTRLWFRIPIDMSTHTLLLGGEVALINETVGFGLSAGFELH